MESLGLEFLPLGLSYVLLFCHSLLFMLPLFFEFISHQLQLLVRLFKVILIPQNDHFPFLFIWGKWFTDKQCSEGWLQTIASKALHLLTITFPSIIDPYGKPALIFFNPLLLNDGATFIGVDAIEFSIEAMVQFNHNRTRRQLMVGRSLVSRRLTQW